LAVVVGLFCRLYFRYLGTGEQNCGEGTRASGRSDPARPPDARQTGRM